LFLFEKYGILQNKFDDDLSSMSKVIKIPFDERREVT